MWETFAADVFDLAVLVFAGNGAALGYALGFLIAVSIVLAMFAIAVKAVKK